MIVDDLSNWPHAARNAAPTPGRHVRTLWYLCQAARDRASEPFLAEHLWRNPSEQALSVFLASWQDARPDRALSPRSRIAASSFRQARSTSARCGSRRDG